MAKKIFCFGDSLVYGIGDNLSGGWVSRLTNIFLKNNKFHTIYNLGVRGDTTHNLLNRLENELLVRTTPGESTFSLIQIGLNDSKLTLDISIETFKSNIQKIIDLLEKHNSKVIFISIPYVNEEILKENNIFDFKNENISAFDYALKQISSENQIKLLDVSNLLKDSKEYLGGVHPNIDGYVLIAEFIYSELEVILK